MAWSKAGGVFKVKKAEDDEEVLEGKPLNRTRGRRSLTRVVPDIQRGRYFFVQPLFLKRNGNLFMKN